MVINRITRVIKPNRAYKETIFTRGNQLIQMSKYLENGIVRSRRIFIQEANSNKYMETYYDNEGKYIKNSFFSSTNTTPRNLDIEG